MAQTGRVIVKEFCVGGEFIFGNGQCLIKYVDRIDFYPTLDASSDIDFFVLLINGSMAKSFLGESFFASLLQHLDLTQIQTGSVQKLPQHINALLCAAMHTHHTGTMRSLYAQTKALEFISALAGFINVEITSEQDTDKNWKDLARRLHHELINYEGKLPSIDTIAIRYGISARSLNEQFKKIYGDTIFSCISIRRLERAHETLLQTDIPIKVLSANLGYSHVNHFTSAFTKKFGYPPGSLRRNK